MMGGFLPLIGQNVSKKSAPEEGALFQKTAVETGSSTEINESD